MSKKRLGILVTSEVHGAHLHAIAQAAERKKLALVIHLQGEAVRLGLQEAFYPVLSRSNVSVCHKSAAGLGIAEQIEALYPHALTSAGDPPLNIGQCAKRIVL